jgi:regulatory protein
VSLSRRTDKPIKRISPTEAFARACRYCAYQERSHREVRNKLFSLGLYPSEVEQLLARLITEGFLNEQRFATAFAGGKFRMQKWGKVKITLALEAHGVSARCIRNALGEIESGAYRKTLDNLLRKKLPTVKSDHPAVMKRKAATFVIGKGFEPTLVWDRLNDLFEDREQ